MPNLFQICCYDRGKTDVGIMPVVAMDSMFVYLKNISSSHKLPVIFLRD